MSKPNINVNVGGAANGTQTYKTVVLKPNIPFAQQLNSEDTIYVVKWDFQLDDNNAVFDFEPYDSAVVNGYLLYRQPVEVKAGYVIVPLSDNVRILAESGTTYYGGRYAYVTTDTLLYVSSEQNQPIKDAYKIEKATLIPSNCVLEFEGGSLTNGTLVGDSTGIVSEMAGIFTDIRIKGTWKIPEITSSWFTDAYKTYGICEVNNLANDDIFNKVYIEKGDYWLDRMGGATHYSPLYLKSNTEYYLVGNIRMKGHTGNNAVCMVKNAHDVLLTGGGSIYGDKLTHIYPDGNLYPDGYFSAWERGVYDDRGGTQEGAHNLDVTNSHHVVIDGINSYNATGDGIFVDANSNNVVIRNCNIYNTRRQGITFNADDSLIEFTTIEKVYGTSPMAGIDIEDSTKEIKNITIRNVVISDCNNGIEVYSNNQTVRDIKIDGVSVTNATHPISFGVENYNVINVLITNSNFIADISRQSVHLRDVLEFTYDTYIYKLFAKEFELNNCRFETVNEFPEEALAEEDFIYKVAFFKFSSVSINNYTRFVSNCNIIAPNNIRAIEYKNNLHVTNCNIKGYSIGLDPEEDITSATNVFFANCSIELTTCCLAGAFLSNNKITMRGPINQGLLSGNRISFTLPNDYSELIDGYTNYVYDAGVKYLFNTYGRYTYFMDNAVYVQAAGVAPDVIFLATKTDEAIETVYNMDKSVVTGNTFNSYYNLSAKTFIQMFTAAGVTSYNAVWRDNYYRNSRFEESLPIYGTFANKPVERELYIGMRYFCTDKQTPEGSTDGIEIIYKGKDTTDPNNPVDIWVDALGRVIS